MTRRAFTFVEMLVVLIIIGILVAISLQIGKSVTENGKLRQTEATLALLDQTLTAYNAAQGGQFPAELIDARGAHFPIFDGRCLNDYPAEPTTYTSESYPSLALYLNLARKAGGNQTLLSTIEPSLIHQFKFADLQPSFGNPQEVIAGAAPSDISLYTINDGWGRPIRFVHPKFDGAFGDVWTLPSANATTFTSQGRPQLTLMVAGINGSPRQVNFRRSAQPFNPGAAQYTRDWVGDADESIAIGGRGYFYSAGPDGNPGTRDDNIYSTKPQFPAEGISAGK
ncbi:hypothetical protein BH11PLA1_BH11PLA1_11320 [soil metagenome]